VVPPSRQADNRAQRSVASVHLILSVQRGESTRYQPDSDTCPNWPSERQAPFSSPMCAIGRAREGGLYE